MSDFWTKLLNGHTKVASSSSLDLHLASDDFGKAVGEDFEGVRVLTDKHREANALPLPVAAGTKVSFTGGLGAFLAYDDSPERGAFGTVVNVKSANGHITHHDGKVFVEWGDGKFRSIHAEHLRSVASGKKASDIKAQFEKIKDLAEKRPDSKFLKSLLKQMADKGFAPTDKQMAVVKKIEGEVKQQGEMKKELAGLSKGAKSKDDPCEDGWEMFGLKEKDGKKVPNCIPEKKAKVYRVSSLGDLTSFLKRADGKLIHKSTQDLWSFNKDADGNFLVSRLFDDNGEPLKG